MTRPEPRVWCGKWVVDLRPEFGSRYVLCDGGEPRDEAIHLAYRLLDRLRGQRLAEPATDAFSEGKPATLAGAVDAWAARRDYATAGGKRWASECAAAVRRELGSYTVNDFAPPRGNDRLLGYVRELQARELAARTVRNRLWAAQQVIRFCVERGWLTTAPISPRLPQMPAPVMLWLTEAQFRELRASIHQGVELYCMRSVRGVHDRASLALYIARRRCYLSVLFYTGFHTIDADQLTGGMIGLDFATYIRRNTKSARVIPDERFEMPEPLAEDLAELARLLGRPFAPDEPITGGRWPKVARVCGEAAARLGFADGANPRIFRRSFAREMFLRGHTVREVADYMGHVSERMLKEIYLRTVEAGVTPTRWKRTPLRHGPHAAPALARVLQITPSVSKEGA